MKKSKKHLSRLGAYLKKEGSRLEKLISRTSQTDESVLVKGILARLSARREIAIADLGLVNAAEEAIRKAAKTKKASSKKAAKPAAKKGVKAPRKAAKKAVKAPAAKRVVRRKPKAAAPASA
jgi:hypothetical protein